MEFKDWLISSISTIAGTLGFLLSAVLYFSERRIKKRSKEISKRPSEDEKDLSVAVLFKNDINDIAIPAWQKEKINKIKPLLEDMSDDELLELFRLIENEVDLNASQEEIKEGSPKYYLKEYQKSKGVNGDSGETALKLLIVQIILDRSLKSNSEQ